MRLQRLYCTLRMNTERVMIVSMRNEPIGSDSRSNVRAKNLLHRASYVYVFTEKAPISLQSSLIVQRRTMSKDYCPGLLDACAGGVVQPEESYQTNAERELYEEYGITGELTEYGSVLYTDEVSRVWGGLFTVVYEGSLDSLVLQEEEVESVEVQSVGSVLDSSEEYTPDSVFMLKELLNRVNT